MAIITIHNYLFAWVICLIYYNFLFTGNIIYYNKLCECWTALCLICLNLWYKLCLSVNGIFSYFIFSQIKMQKWKYNSSRCEKWQFDILKIDYRNKLYAKFWMNLQGHVSSFINNQSGHNEKAQGFHTTE